MTSSIGDIFRPLWGETTGHRCFPSQTASDVELWCFIWSALKQTVKQSGYLRHYRARYDVTVMSWVITSYSLIWLNCSTHQGRVTQICAHKIRPSLGFRWWLGACSEPSHYLNHCWLIINGNLNKTSRFSFKKMHVKISSSKCLLSYFGPIVLIATLVLV